mmetsp:Transcript_65821/g.116884  ORF Transcript_65821/g.116884 Transcript_65821/m.116884 type:complete len:125 (+) Transcript_65821:421-795(+)
MCGTGTDEVPLMRTSAEGLVAKCNCARCGSDACGACGPNNAAEPERGIAGGDVPIDCRLGAATTCCCTGVETPAGTSIAPPMRGVASIPFTVIVDCAEVAECAEGMGGTSQAGALWVSGASPKP